MVAATKNSANFFKIPLANFYKVSFISFLFFCITTILVFSGYSTLFDERVIAFAEQIESDKKNTWMLAITFLGNYQFLVPANLILIFFFFSNKNNSLALATLMIALTGLGWKYLLKALFHRPRPDNPIVEGINNFSYPSGHAMMAVAFYGLLTLFIKEITYSKIWQRITIVICYLLILLIGISRIYLRVHYPTDVIAGYCLGIAWVAICLLLIRKYYAQGLYTNR